MKSRDEIREALTGPVPSIRTPFTRHGDVDFDGLRRVLDFCLDAGGRTMLLTAGDSHYLCLTEAEIAEVTRVTVEHVAGRAMVVAADRYYGTPAALRFAREVRDLGADVLMLMPPDWGASSTPEGFAEHYAAVSEVMPVMIVTNVFLPRGDAFGLKTLEVTLDRAPGVAALKDDVCGAFARKMGLLVNGRWAVISGGQKQNHLNNLPYGCDGYLSTFMAFKPEIARRYWSAIEAGNTAEAVAVIRDIDMPFFNHIASYPGGFDACMHGYQELAGLAQRWRRPPYHSLADEEMERLKAFLEGLGVV